MSLGALDDAVKGRARALAAELKVVQSHHEGGLLEALAANADWANAVLVSPGVLAYTSHALREALQLVGKPAVEVQLARPRKEEPWRRTSLLAGVVEARLVGGGLQAYLDGLSKLVLGETVQKLPLTPSLSEGERGVRARKERERGPGVAPAVKSRSATGAAERKAPVPAKKTLGRKVAGAAAEPGLARSQVRLRIAARLSGELSPADLASWARGRWLELQGGASAESGQRELLEQSLQALALSAQPAGRMTDEQLIELMARLTP